MEKSYPKHVAIILDGNGRWAKKRGLPRNYGHIQGAKAVEELCEYAYDMGVKYLTVYAFSTENWSRPEKEVKALMKLLRDYMVNSIKRASSNNMKVRVLGDKSKLDPDIQASIADLEKATAENTGLNFQIAINYGARDEIRRAMTSLAEDIKEGRLLPGDITDEIISGRLDTGDIPDPDLLIRTCGEQRISNFLLWQLAYSELYFTDIAWPDFNRGELEKAFEAYGNRDRKFGGIKEEE